MPNIMCKSCNKCPSNFLSCIQTLEVTVEFQHLVEHVHERKSMCEIMIRNRIVTTGNFLDKFVHSIFSTYLSDPEFRNHLS